MNEKADTQEIDTAQLCKLTGFVPAFFTAHRDDLPSPSTILEGPKRSRPRYSLSSLADFALRRTAHLSEAECRLILALSGRVPSEELQP